MAHDLHDPSAGRYEYPVQIDTANVKLDGELSAPPGASGLVIFAHGSGSSRKSPRNRHVAHALNRAGLATLLMDLLTKKEEQVDLQTSHLRFDTAMLASRLEGATMWALAQVQTREMKVGYFGASTGAAAALMAAAIIPQHISAVVSRGGRPDLAGELLPRVKCATLLIVGGLDTEVIRLNQGAFAKLACAKQMKIVAGATHLFEEPGTLDEVAGLASEWFSRYLVAARPEARVPS